MVVVMVLFFTVDNIFLKLIITGQKSIIYHEKSIIKLLLSYQSMYFTSVSVKILP